MQIYINRNGQQAGPYPLEDVRSQLAAGTVRLTDLAWYQGAANWMPLSAVPGVVSDGVPSPPSLPAGSAYGTAASSPQTAGIAITSLVLGVLTFFTIGLTGIPAVICGHIARARIRRSNGRLTGSGLALGGLVSGYVGFCFMGLAVLAGIALPVFNEVQDRGAAVKCLAEAKQIGLACKLYAGDHEGKYPQKLEQLIPDYLADDHLFGGLSKKGEPNLGYEYFGGKDSDPPKTVLLQSRGMTIRHQRVTIYSDCSGDLESEFAITK